VTNYLGVDIYLGPLNQPRVPWTGDYQIISGYQNLRISLGRRLQTTIGQLIYHSEFGSRIPPEVGSIGSQDVTALLVEYTKSALQSDPRVNQIVSCTVTLLGNYSVVINAVVLPNGLGQEEVTVNEVIGPP
jgi:phage baseplate assembly protein W